MFGVGGYEWLIIVAFIVLLFVPGIIVFGAGYLTGRRAGRRDVRDEDVSAEERGSGPLGGEPDA